MERAPAMHANLLVDAATTAMMLSKINALRGAGAGAGAGGGSKKQRRKSLDEAIVWYEAAEDCFRRASPGRDKAVRRRALLRVGI